MRKLFDLHRGPRPLLPEDLRFLYHITTVGAALAAISIANFPCMGDFVTGGHSYPKIPLLYHTTTVGAALAAIGICISNVTLD
jgi:hypothetical protein